MSLIATSQDGEIGIITINNPPVNALSAGVPEGVAAAVRQFHADPQVKAIVLIGGGSTFIAGADIRELEQMASGQKPRGGAVESLLSLIENSTKPVIAAIHGNALGGGLETAMACHYRVAVPSARVGQPEVKLGLIPGAGGTQRLPRLAGIAKAVEMCRTGDPIGAPAAVQFGIIDQLVEGDLIAGAAAFARDIIARAEPPRKTRDLFEKLGDSRTNEPILIAAREAARKKQRGLQAPRAAIDAVAAAASLPFAEGLQFEAKLFNQCLGSVEAKALMHLFFGEREVSRIPGITKETEVLPVRQAAIVGAGTMGGGIAMVFANAGIPVLLKEADQQALDRGLATISENYSNSVKKGRLTQAAMEQRMSLLHPGISYDGFETADIVVEAVFEDLALKKKVFAELDKVTRTGVILASNTSTLDIDEIASATSRPEMVVGTHFFSPANVMRLLEIIRGKATRNEVLATAMALAKRLGKVGVLAGNCRGFIGNRMFIPYRREAEFLAEEGAGVDAIDRALTEFGMAMGPLATGDLVGLDVAWRARQQDKRPRQTGVREPFAEDHLYEIGRYGQKNGAGWYRYDEHRTPVPDPEVEREIRKIAEQNRIPQGKVGSEEILERTLYSLINEGARILEEGFALRPVDIDIIYVTGYGFPAYRGGPMFYADCVGLTEIYRRVCEFQTQHGNWWAPAPLLKSLAEQGKKFADFNKAKTAIVC